MAIPATPAAELAARRAWTGPVLAGGVLTADLVALAQWGVSIVLASTGTDRRPVVALGTACRVDPAGGMRIIVDRAACAPLLAAIEAGGGIAATFSRALDHRAFQVKAAEARLLPADPDDEAEVARQVAVLRDELTGIGIPPDLASAYVGLALGLQACAAIAFMPQSAFVQTPGPGAGTALTP